MSLNCQTTQDLFSDYYDGGLEPAERSLLEAHLEACGDCASEYHHYTESLDALHDTKPLETTRMFMANVRAAAAAHLDRKENLLRPPSEAITMVTPRADAGAPGGARPPQAPAAVEFHVPPWVPWALAATTFIAFVLGWAVSGRKAAPPDEERVTALVEERLRRLPAPAVPVHEPVDPRRVLEEQGLVQHQGQWIPLRMRDEFARGMVSLAGKMLSREEAARTLLREFPPEQPATPVPQTAAPSEEEVLARFIDREKYARAASGALVPQDWIRKWEEGWIQTGPDTWKKGSEFREEFARDNHLVEHRGRLMTREEAESLQALQRVKAPPGAAAANEFTQTVEGMEIGTPVSFKGLTVWPVLAARPSPDSACLTLHAALDTGRLEISDTLGMLQIQVRNGLDLDVLLLAGEILAGGRCARLVAEDVLIRAGQAVKVPVVCAEPGAWRTGDKFLRESGHHLAPPSLRRALVSELGQGAVWSSLSHRLWKGAVPADLYRKHAEPLAELRAFFAALPDREAGAVGLAVGWGDALEFLELFPSHEAFAAWFDRILSGAAIDLLDRVNEAAPPRSGPAFANTPKGVKLLLESVFNLKYEPAEQGYGVRRDEAAAGRVTLSQGALQHAILFTAPAAADPDRKAGAAVPREKARKTLDEYEARLKAAGPARRAQLLHEVASLGLPDAVPLLVKQLAATDVQTRQAAIQELGLSADPRAADPLLQVLARSRADFPVFAEAARALARLGDERAADPLIKTIDPAEPENARTVIGVLPELLGQFRSKDVLERSMSRLVGLYESWEGTGGKDNAILDPVGKPARSTELQTLIDAARHSLKQLSGLEFATGAGARRWWNDREVRERWLKERAGRP